jgi:hypothetical protein
MLSDCRADISALADIRTRVVWLQDQKDGTDVFARGSHLKFMGWDSRDGNGERNILTEVGAYRRPLITPTGDQIVFSMSQPDRIMVVNWDGTGLKQLAPGLAVEVWQNPDTGEQWVYAARDQRPSDSINDRFARIDRFRLDNPETIESIWNRSLIGIENFQVSADATHAAATFPWPVTGVARLPNQPFLKIGRGCWTSLAPDNSYLMWLFDGQHRNVILHTDGNRQSWRVNITGAPGVDGNEVYHPRWTNHPHFFVTTGPFIHKKGANAIRGGGTGVEIYLGQFSPDMKRVDAWTRITNNDRGDFFPDAWIDGGEKVSIDLSRLSGPDPASPTNPGVPSRIQVHARLLEKSEIPDPASIAPYSRALAVYRYEILTPVGSMAAGSEILVAHWVIQDYAVIADFSRSTGQSYRMALEDMASHPDLESERIIQDMDVWNLPLFIDMTR